MSQKAYDLIVIGGGPAGSEAATAANERGANVAVIERDRLGGICLNYGCDPTKSLLYVAYLLYQTRRADTYGLQIPSVRADWPAVLDYVQNALRQMRGGTVEEAEANMREKGIDLYLNEAKFASPREVVAGDETLRGERILITAGTETNIPSIDGLTDTGFITHIEAVSLPQLPERLAVIGSGPLGIEFAQMFRRFGAQVTVLEVADRILTTEDQELAQELVELLEAEGICFKTNVDIRSVTKNDRGEKQLIIAGSDGRSDTITVDEILMATGRRPALDNLNLKAAGVETNDQGIVVDDTLRTSVPHIWAAGDVTGGPQFTHVADHQGRLAVHNAFADIPKPFDISAVPWVTYTYPALAHVGKTEKQLKAAGTEYDIARVSVSKIARAMTMDETEGSIKLLVAPDRKILGGHILAHHAGDLIAPVVVAMENGLTIDALADTMMPYPTLASGLQTAARQV